MEHLFNFENLNHAPHSSHYPDYSHRDLNRITYPSHYPLQDINTDRHVTFVEPTRYEITADYGANNNGKIQYSHDYLSTKSSIFQNIKNKIYDKSKKLYNHLMKDYNRTLERRYEMEKNTFS